MKWTFILLLIGNLFYLGWEIERETRLQMRSQAGQAAIPADARHLQLISELDEKPPPRSGTSVVSQLMDTIPGFSTDTGAMGAESQDQIHAAMPEPVGSGNEGLLMELVREASETDPGDRDDDAVATAASVCFSFGPFGREADLEPLRDWFEQRQHPSTQRVEYEADKELFWVYLAPLSDRDEAVAKLSELQKQGVKDYRLIHKGSFRNAISLGLFSSQAGVNRRLSELNAKGYQPVVVPYHDSEASRIYWLDVALQGNSNLANAVFSEFPARYNSLPRDCDQIALTGDNP